METFGDVLEEKHPLIKGDEDASKPAEIRVYRRRWWVMFLFCFTAFTQASNWNTWPPVAAATQAALDWTDGEIALSNVLADVIFIFVAIPTCMLTDTKGLRFSMILCTVVLTLGAAIRCFSTDSNILMVTSYICACINGIVSVLPFAGPPLVSAVWFPLEERPLATAIGTFFNNFGVAMSFIIGPQFVPEPLFGIQGLNNTPDFLSSTAQNASKDQQTSTSQTKDTNNLLNIDSILTGIANLMYTYASLSVFICVAVILSFPNKPPKPPSASAAIERINYKDALSKLARNKPLWLITVAGAAPIISNMMLASVIDVVLKPLGVSQVAAGWMGFYNTITGSIAGVIAARFSHLFEGKRKIFVMVSFALTGIAELWFSLMCSEILMPDVPSFYMSCILSGLFVNATFPLLFEMCAESSYPVAEGVTGGLLTVMMCVFGSIILALLNVPGIGTAWIGWTSLGCVVVAMPLLVAFPETYNRTNIDKSKNTK